MAAPEINWTLLRELSTKPHPNLNRVQPPNLPLGVDEVLAEALAVQHLLDTVGIPLGERIYERDIDARTFLAVCEITSLRERLARISGWHARETGPAGTVGDLCIECGRRWPCDTSLMAEGAYADEQDGEGR